MRYASAQALILCGICQNVAGAGGSPSVDAMKKMAPETGAKSGRKSGQARDGAGETR